MSALSWLKPSTLAATVIVAGTLLATAPVRAQDVTVLRGPPPPQPAATVDCNNPYYAQYCQAYEAWQSQYYSPNYADTYPDYGYGLPVGVGLGFGFVHGGNFHGGIHGGSFHGGSFHGGGRR